jgi:hypothetical protein
MTDKREREKINKKDDGKTYANGEKLKAKHVDEGERVVFRWKGEHLLFQMRIGANKI